MAGCIPFGRHRAYLFALIVLCTPSQSSGEGTFASGITLSPRRVVIPETILLTLFLRYPETYVLKEEEMEVLSPEGEPFALISEEKHIDIVGEEVMEMRFYRLEPRLPGIFPLTFLLFSFTPLSEGKEVAIASPVQRVEVLLPTDTEELSIPPASLLDLSDRFPLEWDPARRAAWIKKTTEIRTESYVIPGTVLLLLCIGYALYRRFGRKRKEGVVQQPIYRQTMLQAEQILRAIESSEAVQPLFQEYTALLTRSVIGRFASTRGERFETSTSEEFLRDLENTPSITPELIAQIRTFFAGADPIKFAGSMPTVLQSRDLMAQAIAIVNTEII